MAFIRRNPLLSFFLLTYGLSWAYWIPLALAGVRTAPGSSSTHFPGLLGPLLAAFIVTGLVQGRAGVVALAKRLLLVSRPTWRFFAYSLSPLIFLGLAVVLASATGTALPPWSDFAVYSGLPPLGLPAVLLLVLLFNGFGEETGWRGFALKPLQRRHGRVAGTLILAALWAGWHTPTFFVVETYRDMTVPMIVGGFGLGICTGASRGMVAAVTTTCVMVWAVLLLIGEARHRSHPSTLLVESAACMTR